MDKMFSSNVEDKEVLYTAIKNYDVVESIINQGNFAQNLTNKNALEDKNDR